jgi:hypothetical protein
MFDMRSYIGKYPKTFYKSNFSDLYLKFKYKKDCNVNSDNFYKFLDVIDDVCQVILNSTINKLARNRQRKIKIRVDYDDLISMDDTISIIIHKMLVEFRKHNTGYPCYGDTDDYLEYIPEDLKTDEERHYWMLDELIWTFEYLSSDRKYESENYEEESKRASKGLKIFGRYFTTLWL